MSAYGGPQLGPDGQWHALWVWRDTPNNASNHSLSYMRSTDLRHWETSSGEPVTLPVNSDTPGVIVEPAGPGGGLSNMTQVLGWDAQQQPVITYHKFDEDGRSQIFNARFADGAWHRVQATEWTYRWDYGGNGALPRKVTGGAVEPAEAGRLQQTVWNEETGAQHILLDAATLEPIRREAPAAPPAWRQGVLAPELDFQVPPDPNLLRTGGPMEVDLIDDAGEAAADGSCYVLRWEHAGRNRDRQVPKPWPEPTTLRVYRISAGEER